MAGQSKQGCHETLHRLHWLRIYPEKKELTWRVYTKYQNWCWDILKMPVGLIWQTHSHCCPHRQYHESFSWFSESDISFCCRPCACQGTTFNM